MEATEAKVVEILGMTMKRLAQRSGSRPRCAGVWNAPAVIPDIRRPRLCCRRLAEASMNALCNVREAAKRSSRIRCTSSGSHGAVRWIASWSCWKKRSSTTRAPNRLRACVALICSSATSPCLCPIRSSSRCSSEVALFQSERAACTLSPMIWGFRAACSKTSDKRCRSVFHTCQDDVPNRRAKNPGRPAKWLSSIDLSRSS